MEKYIGFKVINQESYIKDVWTSNALILTEENPTIFDSISVHCEFDKTWQKKLKTLSIGEKVKFNGEISDISVLYANLTNCELLDQPTE